MEGNKLIVYAVVALVVGAVVGVGVGYVMWNDSSSGSVEAPETTYSFYLYFGAENEDNGWYSAQGENATVAFDRAMDSAGFEYEVSNYGYVGSIDGVNNGGGWYIAQYLYNTTSAEAAAGSVSYPAESYGTLAYSNGWKSIAGFGGEGLQLQYFSSTIYFMTPYNADYSAESPVSVTDWMTTGPFA